MKYLFNVQRTVDEIHMWSGNKCQIIQLTSGEPQDSECKSGILMLAVYQKHLCGILNMLWSGEGLDINSIFSCCCCFQFLGDFEGEAGKTTRVMAGLVQVLPSFSPSHVYFPLALEPLSQFFILLCFKNCLQSLDLRYKFRKIDNKITPKRN